MLSSVAGASALIVVFVAVAWWLMAPVLASVGDKRLRQRNPDHHAKIVRFYRVWGMVAILFGVMISAIGR